MILISYDHILKVHQFYENKEEIKNYIKNEIGKICQLLFFW